ncbi:MAG: response regulator [Patescibacteria group bacterium]
MPPSTPTSPATAVKKVLIIEDEQFISELYVRALTNSGYEVKVAVDGEQALAEAQTDSYDIVLLDIMLPNLTGTEILHRLRDPKATQNIHAKIIITTNLELDEQSKATMEAQADGYIIKAEVTPKELVKFLDQLQLT